MKRLVRAAIDFFILVSIAYPAAAATESVIYNFPEGDFVIGQPVGDQAGHLFGTTVYGGVKGGGYVYELIENQDAWHAKTIYNFKTSSGYAPSAGLTLDRTTGDFYGTTGFGGAAGNGTIFSLHHTGGSWTFTKLHDFDRTEGAPSGSLLTQDSTAAVFYGLNGGGSANCGTAYQIDRKGKFHVLHDFLGGDDGCQPRTQLRKGPKPGQLFGSTSVEGKFSLGTLFLLEKRAGFWTESLLYRFKDQGNGAYPIDMTDMSSDGRSIYGVTSAGGKNDAGVVFQLTRSRGHWDYSVIHGFKGGSDGSLPIGLRLDNATGNLYGTTYNGGDGHGVVFELTHAGKGWTETVLHSFAGSPDGANPESRPYLNPKTGQLFGTTSSGGTNNRGTVYVVTP